MVAVRMVDYIQAVIVSCAGHRDGRHELTEVDWTTLCKAVEKLFSEISLTFHLARFARKKTLGETFNAALEDYYFEAQLYWCNIRGRRYGSQNIPYLRTLLEPHDAVLREVFGCGIEGILQLISDVQWRQTRGLGEAVQEMKKIRSTVLAEIERKHGRDLDEAMFDKAVRESMDLPDRREMSEQIIDRLFGTGLFELRPGDGVSQEIIDALSLAPGEDSEFFSEGEFKGWPLRVWPIWRKPFLRVDGKYMSFDYQNLMDNLYRVLQRLIVKARPNYQEEWNRKQKEVSETWPISLLSTMMPGAVVNLNVFYLHAGKRYELDALVQYDDALFVLEV